VSVGGVWWWRQGEGTEIRIRIRIKIRRKGGGGIPRGHFTRKPVRTSINTGDFER
jgi:hypothetical protein